jgi:gamma-glutamylcyclotransferase (GGCT)/AIG2-like uncharacterized protein YtfP
MVEVSRSLFDSMNNIQTAWGTYKIDTGDNELHDTKDFPSMIVETVKEDDQICLLQSEQIKDFIFLEPQIMNHDLLRRRGYKPDQEIEPKLAKEAREDHKKLVNAYEKYISDQSDENKKDTVIKKMGRLLYIVRSNIAHGEKTIYGPDHGAIERNRIVSEKVIPLQKLLIRFLLDRADRKLVVYGTLAPGEVNQNILSEIEGSWSDCKVNGRIFEKNGLPYFVWDSNESLKEVHLFFSKKLPASWNRLDQFEGSTYKRILIPVTINKEICVANVFEENKNY